LEHKTDFVPLLANSSLCIDGLKGEIHRQRQEQPVERRKAIHNRVLNAKSRHELSKAYDEWADFYDQDLIGEMGYVAPALACRQLLGYLEKKHAIILDAGCGTGLVGAYLFQQGYRNLEGFDYSGPMLGEAKKKGVYNVLHQGDLTRPLDLPDNGYAAIISVGTFTCGHIGPKAFDELIRITSPGGYLCFTVRERAWEKDDYRKAMDSIERSGRWRLIEEKTTDYIQEEGSNCVICVYQKIP
jgi:predicted TPR repeat methyltransferase